MKAMTFDFWIAAGFRVRRGERATGRNDKGEATFTRDQVDEGSERQYFNMLNITDDERESMGLKPRGK
jgi:hypothetical protein